MRDYRRFARQHPAGWHAIFWPPWHKPPIIRQKIQPFTACLSKHGISFDLKS
ncbi:WHG domain-containing protein [Comamonadaceae bacterium OH3737_COT-264]|nr:WHG domain-containing protein [Comamonadaceae bacterium OH3737_COT-264]